MSPKPKSGRARSWLSKERKSGLLDLGWFSTDRQLPRIAIGRGGQEILRQDEQWVASVFRKGSMGPEFGLRDNGVLRALLQKRVSMSSGWRIFFEISVTERGEKMAEILLDYPLYVYIYVCIFMHGQRWELKRRLWNEKKEKQESSAGYCGLHIRKARYEGGSR